MCHTYLHKEGLRLTHVHTHHCRMGFFAPMHFIIGGGSERSSVTLSLPSTKHQETTVLTRRSTQPQGIEGTSPHYNFLARLERSECEVLKQAQAKARQQLGGTPSNGLFLMEVLKTYLGERV